MSCVIHIGDTPTFTGTLRDCVTKAIFDASGATVQQFKVLGPNGQQLTKVTTFVTDGTNGEVTYQFATTDFDSIGQWELWPYIVSPSYTGHFSPYRFEVRAPGF